MPMFCAMVSADLKPMPLMSLAKRYGFSLTVLTASFPYFLYIRTNIRRAHTMAVQKYGYYSFEVGFELSSPTSIVLTLEPRAKDSSPKCQFGLEVAKRSGCRTLAVLTIELLNSLRSRTTLKIHFGLDTTSETSASSPYFG